MATLLAVANNNVNESLPMLMQLGLRSRRLQLQRGGARLLTAPRWSRFRQLTVLELPNGAFATVAELRAIPHLRRVSVVGCTNLVSLEGLERVAHIDARYCSALTSLCLTLPLEECHTLFLDSCTSLVGFRGMGKQLEHIDISGLDIVRSLRRFLQVPFITAARCNRLNSTRGLGHRPTQQYLNLAGCARLVDVANIGSIANVKLQCTPVFAVPTPTRTMRHLDISYTSVTYVGHLTGLSTLQLVDCTVTPDEIALLSSTVPTLIY
jgi:hypothetical protein